ncbi:S1 family peptidase [Pedobacter ghigonis]|uniref:S1 family peptidase n=1 Tax=Pedobacter ghigonis TaxID=2730403 RepID=UPI0015892579|nr:serine protease [Pedobacter ghigonis]
MKNPDTKITVQTKIQYPATNTLDRETRWVAIELPAEDNFGELELWAFQGIIVSIGYMDDEKQRIIGSGVMVAPGICLTATHVMDVMRNKNALVYSFPCKNSMRIWRPQDFQAEQRVTAEIMPFQRATPRYIDVGILSISPFSIFNDNSDYVFVPLEVSIPKIGERLWAAGYREIENDGVPTLSFFYTSGIVTEQYLEGRGTFINGPCVEVAMETLGGMSGGPVFNNRGRVIGIISSSLDGPKGPTYVSMIWTTLMSTVMAPWPENLWPANVAGMQVPIDNGIKLSGSGRLDSAGAYKVKFPEQDSESMLSIFITAGIDVPIENYDMEDFAYENFEEYLTGEGLKYLSTVDKDIFDRALIQTEYTEIIKLFSCCDATLLEGIEDLNIQSVKVLDDGNIGVDALYNLRIVFMRLKIPRQQFEAHKNHICSLEGMHDQVIDEDYVYYDHYTRPFFRVNFSYSIESRKCKEVRFQALTLKI